MKLRELTYILIVTMLSFSCQELPTLRSGGSVVASVGSSTLTKEQITNDVPHYLDGDDSTAFVERYVERWIERQVKVQEAERIFSSSVQEVEAMVASYRQTLLTRKLDQYYINSSAEERVSSEDIANYYRENSDNFRLDRNIVKGRILRLPLSYGDAKKLKSMMGSQSKDSQLNLISISEKNEDFEMFDMSTEWVDYEDFIEMLPIVRDRNRNTYLTRKGVQNLQDSEWSYLFEITAYRSAGYVAPQERVEDVIRQILTNERHTEMVRKKEEQLMQLANKQGVITNHLKQKEETTEEQPMEGQDDDTEKRSQLPALFGGE